MQRLAFFIVAALIAGSSPGTTGWAASGEMDTPAPPHGHGSVRVEPLYSGDDSQGGDAQPLGAGKGRHHAQGSVQSGGMDNAEAERILRGVSGGVLSSPFPDGGQGGIGAVPPPYAPDEAEAAATAVLEPLSTHKGEPGSHLRPLVAGKLVGQVARPLNGTATALTGDTIVIGGEVVRLFAISTPLGEGAESRAAAGALSGLTAAAEVHCTVFARDPSEHAVGQCSTEQGDLSLAMVKSGHATVDRTYMTAPQTALPHVASAAPVNVPEPVPVSTVSSEDLAPPTADVPAASAETPANIMSGPTPTPEMTPAVSPPAPVKAPPVSRPVPARVSATAPTPVIASSSPESRWSGPVMVLLVVVSAAAVLSLGWGWRRWLGERRSLAAALAAELKAAKRRCGKDGALSFSQQIYTANIGRLGLLPAGVVGPVVEVYGRLADGEGELEADAELGPAIDAVVSRLQPLTGVPPAPRPAPLGLTLLAPRPEPPLVLTSEVPPKAEEPQEPEPKFEPQSVSESEPKPVPEAEPTLPL